MIKQFQNAHEAEEAQWLYDPYYSQEPTLFWWLRTIIEVRIHREVLERVAGEVTQFHSLAVLQPVHVYGRECRLVRGRARTHTRVEHCLSLFNLVSVCYSVCAYVRVYLRPYVHMCILALFIHTQTDTDTDTHALHANRDGRDSIKWKLSWWKVVFAYSLQIALCVHGVRQVCITSHVARGVVVQFVHVWMVYIWVCVSHADKQEFVEGLPNIRLFYD